MQKSYFTWGRVINIHRVGEYEFTEYHPYKVVDNIVTREIDTSRTMFHNEVNSHGTYTLDQALIDAICCKYDGLNERLSKYIFRALDM